MCDKRTFYFMPLRVLFFLSSLYLSAFIGPHLRGNLQMDFMTIYTLNQEVAVVWTDKMACCKGDNCLIRRRRRFFPLEVIYWQERLESDILSRNRDLEFLQNCQPECCLMEEVMLFWKRHSRGGSEWVIDVCSACRCSQAWVFVLVHWFTMFYLFIQNRARAACEWITRQIMGKSPVERLGVQLS